MSDPNVDMVRRLLALEQRVGRLEAIERPGAKGTWLPTAAGLTTPGTWTYNAQVGRYEVFDRRCFFDILLRINTVAGAAGDMTISLPLASTAVTTYVGGVGIKFLVGVTLLATTRIVGGTVESGTQYLRITETASGGGATYLPVTAVAAGNWFVLWGMYELP